MGNENSSESPHSNDAPASSEDSFVSTMLVSFAVSGQLVSDRFRVERPVARGGMGEVYRAKDRSLLRSHIDARLKRASSPISLFRFPPATDPGIMDGWEYDIAAPDRLQS